MADVLQIGVNVATPLGVVGLVATALLLAYYRRLKHQEEQLKSLPEEKRAQAVDTLLSRYGIDAGNLTREQKYELIRAEMDRRAENLKLCVIVSAIVFVFCFALGTVAYVAKANQPPQVQPVSKEQGSGGQNPAKPELELSDISAVIETPELPAEPATLIDIKVKNRGNGTAFLTRAVLQVEDVWEFSPFFRRNYEHVPVEKTYEVKLSINDRESVETRISHAIRSQEVDRFQIKIIPTSSKVGPHGESYIIFDVVYKLRAIIIFDNPNNKLTSEPFLAYASNHQGVYTPTFGPATPFGKEIPVDSSAEKAFVDRWVKPNREKVARNASAIAGINNTKLEQCPQLRAFIKSVGPYFNKWAEQGE